MQLDTIKEDIVEHDALANLMAYYETWYQGSLGLLMSITSGFDADDAAGRLANLKLEINPEQAFMRILTAAMQTDNDIDLKSHLKNAAAYAALDILVTRDDEILNKEIFRDTISESIATGAFFDSKLQFFFDSNYTTRVDVWMRVLTDQMIDELRNRLKSVETGLAGQ